MRSDDCDEGLLAAYALDALDRGETAAVDAHLRTCIRCHHTFGEFLATAARLAVANGLVIDE